MAETCGAVGTVHIESQIEQNVHCRLKPDHLDAWHEAQVLDSDDNPIPYRWPNDGDDHDQP